MSNVSNFILLLLCIAFSTARVVDNERIESDEVVFYPHPAPQKRWLSDKSNGSSQRCISIDVDRNDGNILYPLVDDNIAFSIFDHASLVMHAASNGGPATLDLDIDGVLVTGYKTDKVYTWDMADVLHAVGDKTRGPQLNVCATSDFKLAAQPFGVTPGPRLAVVNRARLADAPAEWRMSTVVQPDLSSTTTMRPLLDVPTEIAYLRAGVCDDTVKQIWAFWPPNPADKELAAATLDEVVSQQEPGENLCGFVFDGYGHGESRRLVGDSTVADPIHLYFDRSLGAVQAAIDEILLPLAAASQHDVALDARFDEWHSQLVYRIVSSNPVGTFCNVDIGTPAHQDGPEENVAKCALAPPGTPGFSFSSVLESAAANIGLGGQGVGGVWCDLSAGYNGPALLGPNALNDPVFNDAANDIRSEGMFSRRGSLPWSLDTIQAAPGFVLPTASFDLAFFAGLNIDRLNTTVVTVDPVNGPITQGDIDAFVTRCIAKSSAGGFGTAAGQQALFSSVIWSDAERASMDQHIAFDGFGTSDTAKIVAACVAAAPGSPGPSPIKSPNRLQAFGATVSSDPDAVLFPGFTIGELENPRSRELANEGQYYVQNAAEIIAMLAEGGSLGVVVPSTHYGIYAGDSGSRAYAYMTWINGLPVAQRFVDNGFDMLQCANSGGHAGLAKNCADLYALQAKLRRTQ